VPRAGGPLAASRVDGWSARRCATTAAAGLGLATAIVVCASRISNPEPAQRRLLGSWFGLLPARIPTGAAHFTLAMATIVAVAALVALWASTVRASARHRLALRPAIGIGAAWSLPFLLGPPLFSRDVYSFIAQGRLGLRGLDPYRISPAALGHSPLLAAVDPRWRDALAPYGPLAIRLEELAAWSGSALASVIALRVLAAVSVVAAIVFATRLAAPRPSAAVVALYGLNPVVLFHLESGAHLEAVMVALALGGVLLHRRGHPVAGIAVLTAAGAVKAPILLAVAMLVLVDVWGAHGRRLAVAARDVAAAAGALAACNLLIPDPWGWVRSLTNTDAGSTLATPAVALGHAIANALWLSGSSLSITVALTASTVAMALIAAGFIGRLLATAARRDLLRTAGFVLLLIAVLGPVTHPWYLLWGFAFLMPAAAGGAVRTRKLLLVASGLMAMMEMPGLQGLVAPPVVWLIGIAFAGVVVLATAWREDSSRPRATGLLALARSLPRVLAGA
jgi:hypothetical protein